MNEFYFMVGIITFWVLRFGLIGLILFLSHGLNVWRLNTYHIVKQKDGTHKQYHPSWFEYMTKDKDNHKFIIILICLLLLDILTWLTLLF